MKIKELIKILKTCNQEATVLFGEDEGPTDREIDFKTAVFDGEECLIL